MQYYLGIDPGRKGGIALIDENRNVLYSEPMPMLGNSYDYIRISHMIDILPDETTIVMELKPGVMEKSASPTTSFGFHCGALYGICIQKKLEVISPKTWKSEFVINREYKETRENMKLRSIKSATTLFRKHFKSNEDGIAEALLLAEYGRRHGL